MSDAEAILRWYAALASDRELLAGLVLSLKIAFATACASVVLGTLAAFALTRYRRFFGRTLFSGMVAAPHIWPSVRKAMSDGALQASAVSAARNDDVAKPHR